MFNTPESVATVLAIVTGVATLVGTGWAVAKYVRGRGVRLEIADIGSSFRDIVRSLSSTDEIERLAAAILIRRFFRPSSEYGVVRRFVLARNELPYASDAVDVISALLRQTEDGEFQKALADGLRYAPSLKSCDFQRTNFSNAFLGVRKGQDVPAVDIEDADFYEANLRESSLRGANARKTVFYRATLEKVVFDDAILKDADFRESKLRGASFKNADLAGCRFDGAELSEACFAGAKNCPIDSNN